MAVCVRCMKHSSLFRPLKLNSEGLCEICAYQVEIERREEAAGKKRKILIEQNTAELEKRRIEREKQLQELMKPVEPPEVQHGFVLAYSYLDVEFDSPMPFRSEAQKVPPRQTIQFKHGDDEKEIELWCNSVKLGTMKDNKLRDMLIEFADDDEKGILGATRYWTDKPIFSLFFYLSEDLFFGRWQFKPGYKEFRLSGNRNRDAQETIEITQPGETAQYYYDDDKEKYAVDCDGFLGYLPAAFAAYIDEYQDIEMRVYEVTESDDKYSVSVAAIPKP